MKRRKPLITNEDVANEVAEFAVKNKLWTMEVATDFVKKVKNGVVKGDTVQFFKRQMARAVAKG